jgi:hypothetical protein
VSLTLWPNFGAEEREPEPRRFGRPLRALAESWSRCFADGTVVHDVELDGSFEASRREAAFPCLDAIAGALAWLPTEASYTRMRAAGLEPWGPSPAVVARISDKAWALRVSRELELDPPALTSLCTALDPDELCPARVEEVVASWPDDARQSWTLKPRLGTSGRGRVAGRGARLSDDGRNALARLKDKGGAILEPWLDREVDLSAQVFVSPAGDVEVLGTTRQEVSASGVYRGNAGVYRHGRFDADMGEDVVEALRRVGELVGKRAAEEGFSGPLGVDAFLYGPDRGLRALVEVNARFTTGLCALGDVSRVLQARGEPEAARWRYALRSADAGEPVGERLELGAAGPCIDVDLGDAG